MSKAASLSSVVAKKGDASPPPDASGRTAAPAIEAPEKVETKEPSKVETKTPRKQSSKEETKQETNQVSPARKRPWDDQDDIVKANYEVPRRVQTKLHQLKAWGRVKNIKGFVAESLERALDKEIAAAEKEGY